KLGQDLRKPVKRLFLWYSTDGLLSKKISRERAKKLAKDKKHYDVLKSGNEYMFYKILKSTPIVFACKYKTFEMHDSCPKCEKWIEERGLIRNWVFRGVQRGKHGNEFEYDSDEDILTVQISEKKHWKIIKVAPNVTVNVSRSGEIIAFEISDAKKVFPKETLFAEKDALDRREEEKLRVKLDALNRSLAGKLTCEDTIKAVRSSRDERQKSPWSVKQ
ncbi:MAG: DUF2283 domain-containing protein, partial [Nitrososphaerales archaeon]